MNTTTPSTSLVLPNVITKLMLQSTSETLSDGTKTFTFKGFVTPMDAHLVYLAQATNNGTERHTKNHVVFSAKGNNFDWSVKQNYVPRGKKFYVTFVMNDYSDVVEAQEEVEPTKSLQTLATNEPKFKGFEYILVFNHKKDETPTTRHSTNPEIAIRMARMVVLQYPEATWFVLRRSDGVMLAQSK